MNKTKQQLHVIFIEPCYGLPVGIHCDDAPVESKHNVWEFQPSPLLFAAASYIKLRIPILLCVK